MPTLKTIHDNETGEPSRIRYKGNAVNLGFAVNTTAGDGEPTTRLAVLDCVGAPITDPEDAEAFIDIEETVAAFDAVAGVPGIDGVDAFEEAITNE